MGNLNVEGAQPSHGVPNAPRIPHHPAIKIEGEILRLDLDCEPAPPDTDDCPTDQFLGEYRDIITTLALYKPFFKQVKVNLCFPFYNPSHHPALEHPMDTAKTLVRKFLLDVMSELLEFDLQDLEIFYHAPDLRWAQLKYLEPFYRRGTRYRDIWLCVGGEEARIPAWLEADLREYSKPSWER